MQRPTTSPESLSKHSSREIRRFFLLLTLLGTFALTGDSRNTTISASALATPAFLPTETVTPVATSTLRATITSTPTPTNTFVPTRIPTVEKPKPSPMPSKTPVKINKENINEIHELTNETVAQINLQPGEKITLKYLVYSGDTRLIFSGTGLATDQMEVRSPERLKDRASGGNQKPIGMGNVCPKALLSQFGPGCIVNQSGHWSADPSQNIWQVEISANKDPVQGELKLDNSNPGSGIGCYSYWENIGSNRVFWTHCPGSSG